MIRHTVRALCAASLVIAPLAIGSPAHAVTSCTVNGIAVSAGTVNGTPGSDLIRCTTVNAGDTVNGLGGNDNISITGAVDGTVDAGAGSDYITVGNVTTTGDVLGGTGNDFIRTAANNGLVDGDGGFDYCVVSSGNSPVNCEYPF